MSFRIRFWPKESERLSDTTTSVGWPRSGSSSSRIGSISEEADPMLVVPGWAGVGRSPWVIGWTVPTGDERSANQKEHKIKMMANRRFRAEPAC
jgi:hypothetical protein